MREWYDSLFISSLSSDSSFREGKLSLKEDGHPVVVVEDLGPIPLKRLRTIPPPSERLMVFVRQEGEDIFTPVHLVPPTTLGLLAAVLNISKSFHYWHLINDQIISYYWFQLEDKFKISMGSVKNLFRRNAKGWVWDWVSFSHYAHAPLHFPILVGSLCSFLITSFCLLFFERSCSNNNQSEPTCKDCIVLYSLACYFSW